MEAHVNEFGVEPMCRVLHIAPSTWHEHARRKADPDRLPERDREAAALRWSTADGFNPEPGIDQRIAEPRQRCAGCSQGIVGCQPDEREAGCFNENAGERYLGSAKSVRRVTEEQSGDHQCNRESAEAQPNRAPPAFS